MTQYDVIVVGAGNAALAAAVSAKENGAERVVVLEKAPREMRGGNTHWSGGVLRFAFDDPHEIGPLLPNVEEEFEDFYAGIQPYTKDDFHGDLMRVTSGQTDPVLSRVLVDRSQDTVFWMNRVGRVPMEPAITLTGVRKGKKDHLGPRFGRPGGARRRRPIPRLVCHLRAHGDRGALWRRRHRPADERTRPCERCDRP
jgi:tricarballylate dehydrogenase